MIGRYKTATCSTLSINSFNVLPVSSDSNDDASFWGRVGGHGLLHKTFRWTRSHGHKGRGTRCFLSHSACICFNWWFWYLCVCSCWQDVAFFIISSQEADLCIHLHVNLRSCSLTVSLSLISWFKISTILKCGAYIYVIDGKNMDRKKIRPWHDIHSIPGVFVFCANIAVKACSLCSHFLSAKATVSV